MIKRPVFKSLRAKITLQMLIISMVPILMIGIFVYINTSSAEDSVSNSVDQSHAQLKNDLDESSAALEQDTIGASMVTLVDLMRSQFNQYICERVGDMVDWGTNPHIIEAIRNGEDPEATAHFKQSVGDVLSCRYILLMWHGYLI